MCDSEEKCGCFSCGFLCRGEDFWVVGLGRWCEDYFEECVDRFDVCACEDCFCSEGCGFCKCINAGGDVVGFSPLDELINGEIECVGKCDAVAPTLDVVEEEVVFVLWNGWLLVHDGLRVAADVGKGRRKVGMTANERANVVHALQIARKRCTSEWVFGGRDRRKGLLIGHRG